MLFRERKPSQIIQKQFNSKKIFFSLNTIWYWRMGWIDGSFFFQYIISFILTFFFSFQLNKNRVNKCLFLLCKSFSNRDSNYLKKMNDKTRFPMFRLNCNTKRFFSFCNQIRFKNLDIFLLEMCWLVGLNCFDWYWLCVSRARKLGIGNKSVPCCMQTLLFNKTKTIVKPLLSSFFYSVVHTQITATQWARFGCCKLIINTEKRFRLGALF